MKNITTALQMVVRISALFQIVTGILFWVGVAPSLQVFHILFGVLLVLALWGLAVLATQARVGGFMAITAAFWGALAVVFGLIQAGVAPGSSHWVIQILHLLVGLVAIGLAERLGARIKAKAA